MYNNVNNMEKTQIFTKTLCLYFLCLPLGAMSIGSFGSMLKLVALIPIAVFLVQHPKISLTSPVIKQLLLTIIVSISILWSINVDATKDALEPQVLFLILLFAISGYRFYQRDIDALYKCLRWSSRITAVIVLVTGFYIEGRLALGGIIIEDPNLLCAYFLYDIIAIIIDLLSKPGLKKSLFGIAGLIVYAYIIFSTGSRGGAIAIIGAILIAFMFYKEKGQTKVSKKVILVALLVAVVSFSLTIVSEDMLARYDISVITTSGGVHRIETWQNALNIFKNSSIGRMLVGYGAGCTSPMLRQFGYFPRAMHNVFIQHLLEEGIIGLIIYLSFVFSFLIPCIRNKKFFELSVLIGMILLSLTTNIVKFKPYWNIQIFIICNNFLLIKQSEREGY